MRGIVFGILVTLAVAGAAIGQAFTLQPGDVIEVSVLEDPNLTRQVLVRPDGKIALPIAGTIQAGGRTPEQVQQTILRRLSEDFITPPTVTVSLITLRPPEEVAVEEEEEELLGRVFVIGQVANPGAFEFSQDNPLSALQALALAGGPGVFAAKRRIQIRRHSEDGETIFTFDYDVIEDGEMPVQVLPLLNGDVIVVPERGLFE